MLVMLRSVGGVATTASATDQRARSLILLYETPPGDADVKWSRPGLIPGMRSWTGLRMTSSCDIRDVVFRVGKHRYRWTNIGERDRFGTTAMGVTALSTTIPTAANDVTPGDHSDRH